MDAQPTKPTAARPPGSTTAPPRLAEPIRTAEPPAHASRLSTWLLLVLCTFAALPAMLVEIGEPAVFDPQEAATLRRSIDTWNHYAREAEGNNDSIWQVTADRLVPYRDQTPQLVEPPAMVWGHEAVFALAGPEPIESAQTIESNIVRVRLVSVLFGLLTIAGAFWAGYSLAGTRAAAFAALICAANGVLIYHARLAAEPIVYCGLAMLAIAAGMWAMRPLRPYASVVRQVIGWIICGLALGAATLTVGPTAGPAITFPMMMMVLLCPHRVANMLGLVAAHAIAALVLVPWALQVHTHQPDIYLAWLQQLWPADGSLMGMFEQLQRRARVALLLLLPWTIWLIGALAQPFSASSAGVRQRPFIAFGWFLTTALILLLMPSPTPAGSIVRNDLAQMLLLVPVASVLIGEMFNHYTDLADSGRYPRIWRVLRWPHLLLLVALSLGAAGLFYLQQTIVEQGWLSEAIVSNPGLAFWIGLGIVLIAMIGLSVRYARQEYPARALVCWSVWSIVLASVLWIPMTRSPMMQRSVLPSMVAGPMTQHSTPAMTPESRER